MWLSKPRHYKIILDDKYIIQEGDLAFSDEWTTVNKTIGLNYKYVKKLSNFTFARKIPSSKKCKKSRKKFPYGY